MGLTQYPETVTGAKRLDAAPHPTPLYKPCTQVLYGWAAWKDTHEKAELDSGRVAARLINRGRSSEGQLAGVESCPILQ